MIAKYKTKKTSTSIFKYPSNGPMMECSPSISVGRHLVHGGRITQLDSGKNAQSTQNDSTSIINETVHIKICTIKSCIYMKPDIMTSAFGFLHQR